MVDRILVVGDDDKVFLATCRSLGRAGVEVHAAPFDHAAAALASRYISAIHRLPHYPQDRAGWVQGIRALIDRHGFDLVIPINDSDLLLFQAHGDEIGRDRLAIVNAEALRIFTDKAATRELAASLGVPIAGAALVDPAELENGRTSFPLVLKPRRSYELGSETGKLYAKIVRSEAELRNELSGKSPSELVVEHFYPGVGVGFSVLAKNGRLLLCYQHRRLRQAWETGPSSARVSEAPDPELEAAVGKLAAATNLTGVAMFEFRRQGPGRFVLLEVNARLWGSLPLAIEAGADFPRALYKLFVHALEPAAPGYRTGLARRDMFGEYRRITDLLLGCRGLRGRPVGLGCAMRFALALAFRRSFDTWARDDPEPFYRARRELVGGVIAALATRVRRLSPWPAKPAPAKAADDAPDSGDDIPAKAA